MKSIVGLLQQRSWLIPVGALLLLVIGFGLGLTLGWFTVDFKPSTSDVAAAVDSYYLNGDLALAQSRLKGLSNAEVSQILTTMSKNYATANRPLEADRVTKFANALSLGGGAPSAVGTPAPGATSRPSAASTPVPTSSGSANLLSGPIGLTLLAVVAILVLAAAAIFILRVLPGMRKPRAATTTAQEAPLASAPKPNAPQPRNVAAPTPVAVSPAATTSPGGLGHFVPQYTLGNDNYDTSYSLETARGEFLGECGMGISETIGEGKPDKVTAFDLWLFDKADVRTVTQILMSEYAFNDPTLRTKLAPKGEALLAEKDKVLHLETQSIRVDAKIVELVYATNPSFAPNSHFQKLIVEIVPAQKDGAAH